MKTKLTKIIVATVIAVGSQSAINSAQASVITSLYNTGTDDTGAALSNGAIDSHYSLVTNAAYNNITQVSPSFGNMQAYGDTATGVTAAFTSGWPIIDGLWLGDNGTSTWINPASNSQTIAFFDYQTTFSLTGFDISTAAIDGRWITDNSGVDIILNGHHLGLLNKGNVNAWTTFSIASGYYLEGINTLDFIVQNDGGPTGLRAELTGTASPVPAPAAIWMFGAGLLGWGAALRKKAQS